MKRYTKQIVLGLAIWTLFLQSGCYGSFSLTNKLYDWNGTVGDKFENSLVFFVLCVVPVYEVCALVDGVVLNLVEYWSGSNPISMKDGDYEKQLVKKDGITFKMEAKKNRLTITAMNGANAGNVTAFVYQASDKSWKVEKEGKLVTLVRLDFSGSYPVAHIFNALGAPKTITLPTNETSLASAKNSFHLSNVAVR